MRKSPACVAAPAVARTQTENSRDSNESVAVKSSARRRLAIISLLFLAAVFPFAASAQQEESWMVQTLGDVIPGMPKGSFEYDLRTGEGRGTNGICVSYGKATLTAEKEWSLNERTGDVEANGHVRIQSGDQIWIGEHIRYNFKTHQMESGEFRTGKPPVFAAGQDLEGNTTNQTYTARHVFVTTDDVSEPVTRVRASRIRIVPGKYVEMWNAVLYVGGVPAFYFPYYKRNLGERANNFNTVPGYRSRFGPYLLNTYTWYLGDQVDGQLHLDYRERRGVGGGPDLNLRLGRWGDFASKYYFLHDDDSGASISTNSFNNLGAIPANRQRFNFAWQATPYTNLNLKALVNYQSDPLMLHDFFEGDYTANPQPNTFVEVNKYWENWSVDAETTPRINNFFDQVERLPDVKLTGFRQQVFNTPVYYESESSAGYYRRGLTSTSAQCAYPLADYSAKELKYKKIVTIADDFAYGHEMCAGFQRAFEDNGGKIIQKIFTPLATPDYGSYVAQVKSADAIFLGTAGSNGFRFLRQFIEYGLKDKMAVIGGMTALDESVLRNMGDEALGILTTSWYSAELDNPLNKVFAPAFRKQFKYDPGYYAGSTYVSGEVLEAALKTIKANAEDKKGLMAAIRSNNVQTVRGLVKFDEFGNVIGDVYIRKVTRSDGRLVNSVIKTYPDVSQFWTYDKAAFLKNPVYSRDYPPAKNLEL